MDHVSEFIEAMQSAGCAPSDPSDIRDDDAIHRYHVDGDRPRSLNGAYCLASDGDFAFGWFRHWRTGDTHNWHSKAKRKSSKEERDAHKKRVADAKRARDDRRRIEADAAAKEAQRIWSDAKRGAHPYLERKGINPKGVRVSGDALIIPMWRDRKIVDVQRVYDDGSKYYCKGADHLGAYWSARGSDDVIAIGEGMATMQSVHEATGWSVIAAFDTAGLRPVAKTIRAKYPNARIVIASDNDHETVNAKGEPWNPGLDKAQQAAVAIGGAQVIAPATEAGVTDWNDVHAAHGLDAVRDAMMSAPDAKLDNVDAGEDWEPDYDTVGVSERDVDPLDRVGPLGHNRGEYFFLPRSTGQILPMSATQLGRPQNLYQLAPRSFWETMYAPEESMSKIADYASADLIAECHGKGIFHAENVRGVGAWRDSGKYLVNCGDVIIGEGVRCHPSQYKADSVYEAGAKVIDLETDPLTADEGREFRELCDMLSWKRPQFGMMLAGWMVVSMVGSALTWRPHIVVTGPKGSGKSTVMDKIIKDGLGSIAVKRDGGTTEAGVRKALGCSGRPFVMDEAESESRQMRAEMEKIFFLFRRASSGSVVENANATFVIRSCACFAAINPRIEHGADKDRNTVLELDADKSADRDKKYARIVAKIASVVTRDFSSRLMARTVANMDVLMDNIDVFVAEASKVLGSMRAADQVGPLIAGAYSLVSNKRVTAEFAADWIARQDWQWHEDTREESDSEKLISFLMTTRVGYDTDGMRRESSIGELVWAARHTDAINHAAAVKGLTGLGIRVRDGWVIVSNNSDPIKKLLNDTPWKEYRRMLGNYPNAWNVDNKSVYFSPGINSKATGIPLADVLGDDVDDRGEGKIPMEDWG